MRRNNIFVATIMTLAGAGVGLSSTFVNGGFEDGTLNGWTVQRGGVVTGPAGGLGTTSFGAGVPLVSITSLGIDPITGLPTVFDGTHSVRINSETGGNDATRITQTINNYTDPMIFFAWAAVL